MNLLELMKIKDVVKKYDDLFSYIKKKKDGLGGILYGVEVSIIKGVRTIHLLFGENPDDEKTLSLLFYDDGVIEIIDDDSKIYKLKNKEDWKILYIFISGELMKEFLLTWVEK